MSAVSSTIERTALALAKAALSSSGSQAQGSEQSRRQPKSGISTGKAVLLGAGLRAAGQALVKPHGREAIDSVRHSLAERLDGGAAPAEEDFDEEEYEDEPEGESEEDFDEEGYED